MTPTPNLTQAVPFLWVRDLTASLRCYVDGLGFAMTKQWAPDGQPRWCWLERDGVALMLQAFWREGANANLPAGPLGQGVSVCLMCRDALALYREFTACGVAARRPVVGNGMWVTELHDPDGYRLVFESPTDAPEGSVYAGQGRRAAT